MRKFFLIALKDLKLSFRDTAALLMMLAAPFALTLGMGAVTGRFSGGTSTGLSDISVIFINQDGGELGNALVEMFSSPELADLIDPSIGTDITEAQASVDADAAAAVILIPAGFTNSIIPTEGMAGPPETVQIELYSNPTRPNSVGVIKTILEQFLSQVEIGRIGGQVAVTQLLSSGIISPDQAAAVGQAVGQSQATETSSSISLKQVTAGGEEVKFDVLAYLAPGMALMFLMFTVTYGGRSLLVEQAAGTLPRLLVSPTNSTQILAGKIFGIFLTGAAQLLILIGGTTLMFRLNWGNPLPVILMVLASVLGATGWGILLTALLKTPGQASAIGSAVMLIFGVLGGSFTNMQLLPEPVQFISRITPNYWGLQGFTTLAAGGSLKAIGTPLLWLSGMFLILFAIGVVLFSRRGIGKQ
jgi:ABC-2 type transport system permease protein